VIFGTKKSVNPGAKQGAPKDIGQRSKDAPESPYLAARREWNERYGNQIASAKSWRTQAFVMGIGLIICAGGLVAVSLQSKIVPYAVEINDHGEVVKVQKADVLAKPTANMTVAALRTWTLGARQVFTDPAAIKIALDATYAMTLPNSAAYQKLAEFHQAHNPYERMVDESVSVDIKAIVPMTDGSWQVEWEETTRQAKTAQILRTEKWQMVITPILVPPTTSAQIMVNPLGLYVKDFNWTQRIQ
jgi:type IV secretion system protein VirB5